MVISWYFFVARTQSLWRLSTGVMVFILYKPYFFYRPTPTLHLNLPLTGNFVHFYFLKKTPSELFISFCTHGDLNLVPMSLCVFRFKPPPGYINLYTQIRARSYDLKKWFLKIWQKNWKENSLSLVLAGVESAAVKDVKDRKAQGEFNTHTQTHTHTHTHTHSKSNSLLLLHCFSRSV